MKYYTLDSDKKLVQVSIDEFKKLDCLRIEGEKEMVLAYEDNNYSLLVDGANDIDDWKNAILKMLRPNIYFDID